MRKEVGGENSCWFDFLYVQESRTLYILFSTENCAVDEDPSGSFLLESTNLHHIHAYIPHKPFALVGMKLMPVCNLVPQLMQVAHHYRKRSSCIRSWLQFYRQMSVCFMPYNALWRTQFAELSKYVPLEMLSINYINYEGFTSPFIQVIWKLRIFIPLIYDWDTTTV